MVLKAHLGNKISEATIIMSPEPTDVIRMHTFVYFFYEKTLTTVTQIFAEAKKD